MSTDLADRVVPVWVVCYNADPDQTYTFTSQRRAFASILGSVRTYIDPVGAEGEAAAGAVRLAAAGLREHWWAPYIPVRVAGLTIGVHRLELDRFTNLHQLLAEVADVLGGATRSDPGVRELRRRVLGLFRPAGGARESTASG